MIGRYSQGIKDAGDTVETPHMVDKGPELSLTPLTYEKTMAIKDSIERRMPQELDEHLTTMGILQAAEVFHDRLAVTKRNGLYRVAAIAADMRSLKKSALKLISR